VRGTGSSPASLLPEPPEDRGRFHPGRERPYRPERSRPQAIIHPPAHLPVVHAPGLLELLQCGRRPWPGRRRPPPAFALPCAPHASASRRSGPGSPPKTPSAAPPPPDLHPDPGRLHTPPRPHCPRQRPRKEAVLVLLLVLLLVLDPGRWHRHEGYPVPVLVLVHDPGRLPRREGCPRANRERWPNREDTPRTRARARARPGNAALPRRLPPPHLPGGPRHGGPARPSTHGDAPRGEEASHRRYTRSRQTMRE